VKSGSTARTPLSGPECPALRRSRHGHDTTPGEPPPPPRGGSTGEARSPERYNSLITFGNAVKNMQILHPFAREGSGLFQSKGPRRRGFRKNFSDLQLSCAIGECHCDCYSLGRRIEPVRPGSHFIFLHLRHPSCGIGSDDKTDSHRVELMDTLGISLTAPDQEARLSMYRGDTL